MLLLNFEKKTGTSNRKHLAKMRRFLASALPKGLPEHRQRVDEDPRAVLPKHRGVKSEPVQENLGHNLRGSEQSLSQASTAQSRLVSRDHGSIAQGSVGRL